MRIRGSACEEDAHFKAARELKEIVNAGEKPALSQPGPAEASM
jgi:hypothetical protein